jgi:hypothetical protein
VNHQADSGPHPDAWIKYMNGASVLEIEVVQRSSRAHAWDRTLAHEQIKRRQSADEIGRRSGIYASPDAN